MTSHDEKTPRTADETLTSRPRRSPFADPAPLGLFSFGSTTLILSLYNLQARGIHHPNVVIGMTLFCGGLAQLLAGMWEFPKGNTFGATAFSGYGAFWLSYGTILYPGSGVVAAYAENPKELGSALGIYLITWGLVTFMFFLVALRKSVAFSVLFLLIVIVFFLLAAGEFTGNELCAQAGGGIGVVGALVAYYVGFADMLNQEQAPVFRLPLGLIGVKRD